MAVKCCTVTITPRYRVIAVLLSAAAIVLSVAHVIERLHSRGHGPGAEPIDVVYTWVNGSDPKFLRDLHEFLQSHRNASHDWSSQRYDDKYELKFSLRSLEKYAPWVHHVYIVTNGQIPYWLDLDYERVTLVDHREIFSDAFDLPSFSSPAIESHLHRIPGLSNRFIYFNDDVFLGLPVYPDDFFSPSRGYSIYLAWPLPMCASDCPWVYVGDGQCDSACYNPSCQMDGDDCSLKNKVENFLDENYPSFQNSDELERINELLLFENRSSHGNVRYLFKLNNTKYNSVRTDAPVTKRNRQRISNPTNQAKFVLSLVDPPKLLNSSRLALRVVPTVRSIRAFLKRNATNFKSAVVEHNKNVILRNKRTRKKRKSRGPSGLSASGRGFDAYGASLQHTNRVYNLRYGFRSRYVPAHAPIMIERRVIGALQDAFAREFRTTSRNRIRSEDDMQYAFSYYYFLINERHNLSVGEIFDRFDTDTSGTWSDREIRTVLTKLYDLPLSYAIVDHFEDMLLNCSKRQTAAEVATPQYERYVDSKLPTVSRNLITNCPFLSRILRDRFGLTHKYNYEIISNAQSSHVTFKMLNSNVSEVVGHLDEIRRQTRKFVCLNDDMDEAKPSENELIRAVLYDFYLSLFPRPSRFELPSDFRNRFLYLDELNQWKGYHFRLRLGMYVCVALLCYLAYCNLFKRRLLYRYVNKLFF